MKFNDYLNESGIKGIKELANQYKEAEIYYHIDLDGVTSAICMKEYLKQYGIKLVRVTPIQYGEMEYTASRPIPGVLHVIVDYAHGKGGMTGDYRIHIHTDHHDKQHGVDPATATAFVKAPANAAFLSDNLSKRNIFSSEDLEIISMVDSANFIPKGITVDDVMRSAFKIDKNIDVEKNHIYMGLVVNKLLLSYKTKPNFLNKLIINSSPSLMSIYNNIKKLASEAGYDPPETIAKNQQEYQEKHKESKDSVLIGSTIAQYGSAGAIFKTGSFDRYLPFKKFPEADFLVIVWPMGIVQVSKNPFKAGENPYNLGDICQNILKEFESKLKAIDVSLFYVKNSIERIKKKDINFFGYNLDDMIALIGKDKIKGLERYDLLKLKQLADRPLTGMDNDEITTLKRIKVTAWDIIQAASGGHKNISNVSGWNLVPNYLDTMKLFGRKLVLAMKDKTLK